ncbi:hypothetical protein GGTG_08714 [Gaeumannomyces tritici R3-111a-1]|uniref:Uncharacterized protein n=1 Tax=Gaeumannomyces tritici (strain R3-111a-1) TaxID=644352 RepID=J3P5C5_GAET3|nr:hypothetical protein GGTG_08714 [Gaeumannomyces tritici R3-111a-1]EJT74876.1 hypothetical protein GGTG_08714 [Gaeumannomyces tritici R3-111a-1]
MASLGSGDTLVDHVELATPQARWARCIELASLGDSKTSLRPARLQSPTPAPLLVGQARWRSTWLARNGESPAF